VGQPINLIHSVLLRKSEQPYFTTGLICIRKAISSSLAYATDYNRACCGFPHSLHWNVSILPPKTHEFLLPKSVSTLHLLRSSNLIQPSEVVRYH